MANRNMQQPPGMQSSSSPPPAAQHGADSPADEQPTPNKDSPAPPPQQQQQPPPQESPPPAAENPEEPGDASREGPAEMTLDMTSFRKPWEKTFTQRSRLFVGSLPTDIQEEEFTGMFSKYGKANDVFINRERGFGFIRLVRRYKTQLLVFLFVWLINSFMSSCDGNDGVTF